MTAERVAVAGSGQMGRGIADFLGRKGVSVLLLGRDASRLGESVEAIGKARAFAVRRKRIDPETAAAAGDSLAAATYDEALGGGADLAERTLLVETVREDGDVKREVIARLAPALAPDALVATNTSALPLADLAPAAPDPARFCGLHFMNPPETVNLVELAWTENTSDATKEQIRAFCTLLERQTVEVAPRPGYIVNRLLMGLINEAARLVEEGVASPGDVDKAMRLACGHPMGPAALADFIGLDTVTTELATLAAHAGPRYAPAEILGELVADGRLGRKSGGGLLRAGQG